MNNKGLSRLISQKLVDQKFKQLINVTLAGLSISTIGELLAMQDVRNYSGVGKKKWALILELQDCVRAIVDYQEGGTVDTDVETSTLSETEAKAQSVCAYDYLPANCSEDASTAVMITDFIEEFTARIADNRQHLKNKRVTIRRTYVDGLSRNAIYLDDKVKVGSIETIRQILSSFSAMIGNIVESDSQDPQQFKRIYHIEYACLHPIFFARLKELKSFMEDCPTDKALAKKMGCKIDSPTITFALDIFNMKVCSNIRAELRENFVSPVDAKMLTDGIGLAFDKLYDVVEPYNELELKGYLHRRIKDRKVLDTIINILKSSSQFEFIGDKCQLKWEELNLDQRKAERILFESGKEMHADEIEREFQRRSASANVACNKVIVYRKSNRIASVRPGYWRWIKGEDVRSIDQQSIVRNYALSRKRLSLSDVCDEVKKYVEDYNEKTIRAYVTNCCYETSVGDFVCKEYRSEYKSVALVISSTQLLEEIVAIFPQDGNFHSVESIQSLYESKYGKLAGKADRLIYKIFYSNPELFDSQKTLGRGGKVLYRIKSDAKHTLQSRNEQGQNQPATRKLPHTQMIFNAAVDYIQSQMDGRVLLRELVKYLKAFLPKGKPATFIYKLLCDIVFVKQEIDKETYVSLNSDYYAPVNAPVEESDNEDTPNEVLSNISKKEDGNQNVSKLTDEQYAGIKETVRLNIEPNLGQLQKDGMPIVDFESSWDRFVDVCGVKSETKFGAFQRTFRYLYKYLCQPITFDDKFYLYDELNRRFEEYLHKILLKDEGATLSSQIEMARENGILPKSREQRCRLNSYISNLKYYRNGPAHKNGNIPPDSYMVNAIYQALTLYAYVADRAHSLGII